MEEPGPPRRVADQVWTDLDPHSGVLLLPLGSTEQHGPHLPLATDSIIAEQVSLAASTERSDTWVGPTLPYGASGEHQDFPGTLSIGTEALHHVIVELVRSAMMSFSHVVLVNGHGGNTDAIRRAVSQLVGEGHPITSWHPTVGGDAHAGHTETSLLRHLVPDKVRSDRLAAGATEPLKTLLPRLRETGVRSVSPTGILGDATSASESHGEELMKAMVTSLIAHLEQVSAGLSASTRAGSP